VFGKVDTFWTYQTVVAGTSTQRGGGGSPAGGSVFFCGGFGSVAAGARGERGKAVLVEASCMVDSPLLAVLPQEQALAPSLAVLPLELAASTARRCWWRPPAWWTRPASGGSSVCRW
jgi:hypothetical protein